MLTGLEVTNLLGPPEAFLALQEGPVWLEQQVLHYSEEYYLRISQPGGKRQSSEARSFPSALRSTCTVQAVSTQSTDDPPPQTLKAETWNGHAWQTSALPALTPATLSLGGATRCPEDIRSHWE